MSQLQALLTETEAAANLLAKPATLRKWRARDRGPSYLKLGGLIRYRLDDLNEFLETSRVVPGVKRGRRRGKRAK
jgi:hypothetical protein